jgi:adenylate cyclase
MPLPEGTEGLVDEMRALMDAAPVGDPGVPDADRHRQALARVRSLLIDLGTTEEEIDKAVNDDTVDLLIVDRMLVPAERRLTQSQIADRTGIPLELARRIWRALGFLDVGDDDLAFTEMDIEAIRLFQAMVAMGLVDVDSALQMARVIGSSMARIAEAETAPGSTPMMAPSGDSVIDADEFARVAGASLPAMARLLEFVWRRHLQAATRRAMLIRTRGGEGGIGPVMVVGFADMVGFTMLSQHLGDRELAAVVSRFEELAHDIVTSLGGRVVKMIGDEAMFVVPAAADAARIGLSLAEAYADDDLLSDVRVAMAVGPVLVQDGDYYGPVVNLASRLVGIANPGTVLISDELHRQLEREADAEVTGRALRPRNLKNIGRVQAWKLSRRGTAPGADGRRNLRWERLGEVLRELDDLRDRGEKFVAGGTALGTRRPGLAVSGDAVDSIESERSDAVSSELEPPFERDEGTTP